jgi:uncharacterized protein (DUF1501 family)
VLTRRSLLKSAPFLVGLGASMRAGVASAGVRPAIARRYVVQVVLSGGADAIYFTDPKERSEVDPDVDVPYEPKDILSSGGQRFGPLFAPLLKWAPKITVVNGVTLGTANHPAGVRQLIRLRTGATEEMPLAVDLIGARREGQALPSVAMSGGIDAFMPNGIAAPVFSALDRTSPDDLQMMARVMRKRHGADAATRANVEATADLFERLAKTPRFEAAPAGPPGSPGPPPNPFNQELARALWLMKHDLTRCILVGAGNWDSHLFNSKKQAGVTKFNLPALVSFLSALETTSNEHGNLFDNTLVVLASEVGRYPLLNPQLGKDHFPEAPFIFINAASGGQTFGQTGRRMEALPFGKRRDGKVTLTDIGATVLRIGGINPETCGYVGEPLDFLGA